MNTAELRRRSLLTDDGGEPIEELSEVDFGLSVVWFNGNLYKYYNANTSWDYGYYYQWAGITPYNKYSASPSTLPYCTGNYPYGSFTLTKYNTKSSYGTADNRTKLQAADDPVTQAYGSWYRIPTIDEYCELYKHCTGKSATSGYYTDSLYGTTSVSTKGVYWVNANAKVNHVRYNNSGVLFVGQDITKRIFFPAAGWRPWGSTVEGMGELGRYWARNLNSSSPIFAYAIYFSSTYFIANKSDNYRSDQFSIRGVKLKQEDEPEPVPPPTLIDDIEVDFGTGVIWTNRNLIDTGFAEHSWDYGNYYTVNEKSKISSIVGSNYRLPEPAETANLSQACGCDGYSVSGSLSGNTSVSTGGIYYLPAGTTVNGITYKNPGVLLVSKSDITKRIFFPYAGCYNGSTSDGVGVCAMYPENNTYRNLPHMLYSAYASDYKTFNWNGLCNWTNKYPFRCVRTK